MQKTRPQQLGQAAEAQAVQHLVQQGFRIVARNYRHGRAEIDIIAQNKALLLFVEVKARSSDRFGQPEDFVTPKQQALVRTAAEHYIIANDWDLAIRFDIIAILCIQGQGLLTHFEDAF